MIKAVIFDCFGVLTEDGWLAFLNKYATKETVEELRYLNHQVDRGQMQYDAFLESITRLTGAQKDTAHAMITTTHHPNEALFSYIKKLKDSGYILGIISNAGNELTNYLPNQCVDLFDHITLSYQAGVTKPDPEIYELHLNDLGLSAEQTVFIDDRELNCEGARAVGMNAILYKTYDGTIAALKGQGITQN